MLHLTILVSPPAIGLGDCPIATLQWFTRAQLGSLLLTFLLVYLGVLGFTWVHLVSHGFAWVHFGSHVLTLVHLGSLKLT